MADNYECPLNVDVQQRALAKLNVNEADTNKTLSWMGATLNTQFSLDSFATTIQDGEVLCSLLNNIQAGTVKKVHSNLARNEEGQLKPMALSKARENVTSFLHGAQALGVPNSALFDTLDVVNLKNMNLIIQCISMLGRTTGGISTSGEDSSSIQGKLNAAKQGNEAMPTIFANRGGSSNAKASPLMPIAGTQSDKAPEDFSCPLEDDIKAKAQTKLGNMAEEKDAIEGWIQAVLGDNAPQGFNVETSLRDGQLLCMFVNSMWPGTITKVHQAVVSENGSFSAPAKFKAQENVTAFIKACQAVGVPQSCVFDTLDVVDSKDLNGVLQCLSALGRVSANRTDYGGPQLYAANDGAGAAQKLLAAQQESKGSKDGAPTIFRN